MFKESKSVLAALAMVLTFSSCSGKKGAVGDPKQQLTDYIAKSFSVKSEADRKDLAVYLTGDAKRRLLLWSDEQFREAFIDSKRKFIRLAFYDVKTPNKVETNITYELTYQDSNSPKGAKITNRKLCMLTKEGEAWLIREVKNIKETVEYENEMSLP